MGCFSIPKNKSKVASHHAEQNSYHGSKPDHLLLPGNKPVVLPDPHHLAGEQSPGTRSISAPAVLRLKSGKERPSVNLSTNSNHLSSRLINHNPRALSAPVNYPSPSDDSVLSVSVSATPFSAPLSSSRPPLDSIVSTATAAPPSPPAPFSPPTPSYGSPLCCAGVGLSDVKRSSVDRKTNDNKQAACNEKKTAFGGRPVRLPKPQVPQLSNGHPLPLPHPSEFDESVVAAIGAIASPNSVARSPNRGKDGFGTQNYAFRNVIEARPLPPPALPTESRTPVRAFSYAELAQSFAPEYFLGDGVFGSAYKTSVDDGENNRIDVAVVCPVIKSLQGLKEWMAEVNWLARLQDPCLCKLIGYCAEDIAGLGSKRLLVYEFMCNGSLDKYVKGKEMCRQLDWSTRMRVALDIAQGLAYLHDKAPFQVICRDLSSPSIQLDKGLRAKLSGFGLARCGPEGDQGPPMAGPYVAPESGSNGLVTIKSNAWSFGVVLLELLTGRRHMDPSFPSGKQNLVQLTKPFLRDEGKLFLILDPELNGRYSARGALKVANLAFQCLIKEASLRPNLSEAVDVLKTVQTDEESLASDLKKSRSLTQSVGSPVNYSRSTSDPFIQRGSGLSSFTSSVTSSPSSDPKQRDREFLKLATLGSATSSPSYMESRLSNDLKQPKSIFNDRDALKVPIPAQPLESRQHIEFNHQRERDPQKLTLGHFVETVSSSAQVSDMKQRGLRKVASYGTVTPMSSFSDSKQSSSPGHKLQPGNSEIKQQSREAQKLSTQQIMESTQQSEIKQRILESRKLATRHSSSSLPSSGEIKQQSPECLKLPSPQSSSSLPSSGEIKQQILEGRKLSTPQPSSSLPTSGEMKQKSPEGRKLPSRQPCSPLRKSGEIRLMQSPEGPLRTSGEIRVLQSPERPLRTSGEIRLQNQQGPLRTSGEMRLQSAEGPLRPSRSSGEIRLQSPEGPFRPSRTSGEIKLQGPEGPFRPSRTSGEISQLSPEGQKLPTPHSIDSAQHSSYISQQDRDSQKLPLLEQSLDFNTQLKEMKQQEQESQKSASARSSASSRSSCAPALSFDPPMLREAF